jgi:hypothetical protein
MDWHEERIAQVARRLASLMRHYLKTGLKRELQVDK